MKAFFSALVLSVLSAVVGVVAATGLHQITLAGGGTRDANHAPKEGVAAEQDSRPKRQPVNYQAPKGGQHTRLAKERI